MRALKVLVIAMGIAILIATTVLVTVIIQRGTRLASGEGVATPGGSTSAMSTAGSVTKLALPPGAAVRETRLDGDRLVLRARLEDGREAVFLFAVETGALVRRYDIFASGAP